MRISFERSGGLFAGAMVEGAAELSADSGSFRSGNFSRALDTAEAGELRRALSSLIKAKPEGDLRNADSAQADRYQYDVSIESNGTTLNFTIGEEPLKANAASIAGLHEIAAWVKKQAREVWNQKVKAAK